MIAALQPRNLMITVAEAVVTAVAAGVVLMAGLSIWVMFIGWISYYTRGVTPRDGVLNVVGVLIGLALGLGAGTVLQRFGPEATLGQQVILIFGVALVVLSLRFLPKVNNLLALFLGLVTFFAAHAEPSVLALVPLASASAVGVGAVAGALAHALQSRLQTIPLTLPFKTERSS